MMDKNGEMRWKKMGGGRRWKKVQEVGRKTKDKNK